MSSISVPHPELPYAIHQSGVEEYSQCEDCKLSALKHHVAFCEDCGSVICAKCCQRYHTPKGHMAFMLRDMSKALTMDDFVLCKGEHCGCPKYLHYKGAENHCACCALRNIVDEEVWCVKFEPSEIAGRTVATVSDNDKFWFGYQTAEWMTVRMMSKPKKKPGGKAVVEEVVPYAEMGNFYRELIARFGWTAMAIYKMEKEAEEKGKIRPISIKHNPGYIRTAKQ